MSPRNNSQPSFNPDADAEIWQERALPPEPPAASASGRKTVVLRCSKPRYDGGIELNLERYFQMQRSAQASPANATNLHANLHQGMTAPLPAAPRPEAQPAQPVAEAPKSWASMLPHYWLMVGPLELLLGALGWSVASLALFYLHHMAGLVEGEEHQPATQLTLVAQAQEVATQCKQLCLKGLKQTVALPYQGALLLSLHLASWMPLLRV